MSHKDLKKSAILLFVALASSGVWAQPYASKTTVPQEPPPSATEEKGVAIVSEPEKGQKAEVKKARRADWDLPVQLDENVRIAKVYSFLNDSEKTKAGHDASLNYEFKYYNHGAITEAQKKAKRGHYFVVSWENEGTPTDMTLRFDYRQSKTQDLVHTLEIPFHSANGFYKANFSVIGDAYAARGTIKSWRVSVVHNGVIVAKEQSYIW